MRLFVLRGSSIVNILLVGAAVVNDTHWNIMVQRATTTKRKRDFISAFPSAMCREHFYDFKKGLELDPKSMHVSGAQRLLFSRISQFSSDHVPVTHDVAQIQFGKNVVSHCALCNRYAVTWKDRKRSVLYDVSPSTMWAPFPVLIDEQQIIQTLFI